MRASALKHEAGSANETKTQSNGVLTLASS